MEREMEEMQFLDAFGIVGEAFRIMRSASKLLGSITLTLLFPLSFLILAYNFISAPLLNKIMAPKLALDIMGTPAHGHTLYLEYGELSLLTAAYLITVMAFSLLSTSAVVYTVASIYTSKELYYTKIMSVVPRVWKRLMLTFLWFSLINFLYNVAIVCAMILWVFISIVLIKLKPGTVILGVLLILIVAFSIQVYLSMLWQVASVVSVVEESYGLGAMKKSRELIKGKRDTALTLNIMYMVVMGIIGGYLSYEMYLERHQVMMSVKGMVVLVLQSVVIWIWLLTQSVFYFVCKSCHREGIDKSTLSNHLEAYSGGYMLLKDGNIQLSDFCP